MWLKQIRLEGIRNLVSLELSFDKVANYFVGDNGAGKTSLLEAIHLLAVGRSFRTSREQEVLKISAPYWKITGSVVDQDTQGGEIVTTGEIRFVDNTKTTFLHGIKQEKLSSYLGWLPVVTILLADIELISGAPQIRRNFIDLAISKINKNYLKNLINYRHILIQRNKLLQENADDNLYEAWETDLAKYGGLIFQDRQKFLPILISSAEKFYSVFMPDQKITFEYKTNLSFDAQSEGPNEIQNQLLNLLKTYRLKEKELGHTVVGPHRDEIVAKKGGLSIRRFGSEGEIRLAGLSLKLAEAELLAKYHRHPIFLLDEIAAELDTSNVQKLFGLIKNQIFYATTKFEIIDKITKIIPRGKVFFIENGKVKKIETVG